MQREGTLAAQHLVHPVARADVGHHVGHGQPGLVHAEFDGLDGVERPQRVVFFLPGLDEGDEGLEVGAFLAGGVGFSRSVEDGLHNLEGIAVVGLGADGAQGAAGHGLLSTVRALIRSHSAPAMVGWTVVRLWLQFARCHCLPASACAFVSPGVAVSVAVGGGLRSSLVAIASTAFRPRW